MGDGEREGTDTEMEEDRLEGTVIKWDVELGDVLGCMEDEMGLEVGVTLKLDTLEFIAVDVTAD